jgi:GT2 family glycosyltransferase
MFGDSVHRIEQLHGARMTARREAIQRCRFDEAIVINYHDDSEISWRLASVGALVELDAPLIFHAEAARPADGSRRDFRTRAAWVLNHAYLCRKLFGDSAETERAIRRYARGTAILDLFTGLARRDLSSFRGSNHARRRLPALLRASRETMASVLIAESEKL